MAGSLISGMISLLQQPGSIPAGLEEERQKLLTLFSVVQPLLLDAENRATADEKVIKWLNNLKAATYDANDVLAEFKCEKLCAEAENRDRDAREVSSGFLSSCKINSWRKNDSGDGMGGKLKGVVERINDIVQTMRGFCFKHVKDVVDNNIVVRDEIEFTGSEEVIVGLEKEKNQILSVLFNWSTETITIISILGYGGTGKTTLAHSVFCKARERQQFELLLWVKVGQINVAKILKCIIDQVIGKDCYLFEDDMDLLQRRLRQELSGRRYLLVLDDVSRLDGGRLKLKKLCSWLKQGGDGSFIIVTIRDEPDNEPNGMTMSRVHEYKLGFLYYKESWELFCRRAFTTGKWEYPELLEIGKIFIEMCYGVPFNLNLLGSLMRFKKEYAEWLDILHQLENFRKLRAYAILQVCWNNLHPDTKRCLAFCSVFPSDSHIDKDVMIKLWIANGLIGPDGWANPEVRGNQIFNELVTRYFFRDVKCVHRDAFGNKHEFQGRIVCKMSGIVCDFARYIASSEYSRLKLDQPMIHTQQQARFVSISGDSSLDIAMSVEACPVVSTLISPVESFAQLVKCNALPKSNTLRVLHLRSSLFQGDLSELKYMKHLTYLDLSGSRIKTLPEAMSTLYSMQTLNLSKCLLLCHLPKGMRYMRSLRHLSVDRCPKLKKMPAHLGELSCLQTLTTYIICEDAGCGIDEIKGLNLGGLLELYNIRKVKDALEAKEVDLFAKQGLESLTLCWGGRQNIAPRANNCFDVLEALKPHVGLKVLKIQQYGDPEFSAWLANPVDLKNLVELHLILCTELKSVPMVWHLPCLRVLCLKYMDSLSYIHNSTSLPGGSSEGRSRLFPALKRLMLVGMKSLNEWQEGEAEGKVLGSKMLNFPVLDEMEIIDCPKLEIMPTAPCLKHLTVKTENPMLLWSVCCLIAQSSSLVEANITNTSSTNSELPLTSEKESENYNKCSLRRLRLDATNHFFMSTKLPHIFLPRRSSVSPLSFWRSFELLEYLDIFNCNDLEAWPQEELECLIRLRRLSIRVCKRLTGSSAESSKELTLPRLESLQIYGCPRLKKIPMCSSSLKDLELDECPEITSISSNECPADLETLYISCTTWTSLPNGLEHLTKLKSLRVTECYSLTNLPDGMRALTSLKSLIVNECPRVKSLPQCSGLEQVLSGLELLKISRCPDLELFCGAVMYRDIISRIPRKIIGSTD